LIQQSFLPDFVLNTGKKTFEHYRHVSDDVFLQLLADGYSQSMVAKKLGKNRSFVNYRVKKLLREGKIERRKPVERKAVDGKHLFKRAAFKNYPIIYDVLVSVQKPSSDTSGLGVKSSFSKWFPHHFKVLFKFEGKQPSKGASKSWGMRNWRVFEWSQYPSVTVVAKPHTLEVIVWKAEGASIEERVESGYGFARSVAVGFAAEHGLVLLKATPLNLRHWVLNDEVLSKRVIELLDLKGKPAVAGLTTDLSHKNKVEAQGAEGELAAKRLESLVSGELQAQVKATNDWLLGEVARLQTVVVDLVLEVETLKAKVER
jgi:DNA-binding Lrp family transcriptional regulator